SLVLVSVSVSRAGFSVSSSPNSALRVSSLRADFRSVWAGVLACSCWASTKDWPGAGLGTVVWIPAGAGIGRLALTPPVGVVVTVGDSVGAFMWVFSG